MNALTERWAVMSARERLLITVAGGLALLFILSVFVVRPLGNVRANGMAAFEQAAQTRAAVRRAAGSGATDEPASTGPLRGIVSDTAAASGIVIDRYDIQDGAIDLTIGEAEAPVLFAWLDSLSTQHGVVVNEAVLRENDGGVSARLTLGRR